MIAALDAETFESKEKGAAWRDAQVLIEKIGREADIGGFDDASLQVNFTI